jgi:hypothetical protein
VTPGRSRWRVAVVLAAVLPGVLVLAGCVRTVEGTATASRERDVPSSVADLGALVVTAVRSGLPRLPDRELEPPAGAKRVEDVAGYSDDPAHERSVLEHYGYRFGWERFWGTGTEPMTGVFVDQFRDRAGADAYAGDLARNDARVYSGMLREDPPHLPGGCRSLTVQTAEPDVGLPGPSAFAWCVHGVFSVTVTAVADTVEGAGAEVRAVMVAQLRRLPPR